MLLSVIQSFDAAALQEGGCGPRTIPTHVYPGSFSSNPGGLEDACDAPFTVKKTRASQVEVASNWSCRWAHGLCSQRLPVDLALHFRNAYHGLLHLDQKGPQRFQLGEKGLIRNGILFLAPSALWNLTQLPKGVFQERVQARQ